MHAGHLRIADLIVKKVMPACFGTAGVNDPQYRVGQKNHHPSGLGVPLCRPVHTGTTLTE
jgi:hypothetical protein